MAKEKAVGAIVRAVDVQSGQVFLKNENIDLGQNVKAAPQLTGLMIFTSFDEEKGIRYGGVKITLMSEVAGLGAEEEETVASFDRLFPFSGLDNVPLEFGVLRQRGSDVCEAVNGFMTFVLNREGRLDFASSDKTDKDDGDRPLVDVTFTWRDFVATTQVLLDNFPQVFRSTWER